MGRYERPNRSPIRHRVIAMFVAVVSGISTAKADDLERARKMVARLDRLGDRLAELGFEVDHRDRSEPVESELDLGRRVIFALREKKLPGGEVASLMLTWDSLPGGARAVYEAQWQWQEEKVLFDVGEGREGYLVTRPSTATNCEDGRGYVCGCTLAWVLWDDIWLSVDHTRIGQTLSGDVPYEGNEEVYGRIAEESKRDVGDLLRKLFDDMDEAGGSAVGSGPHDDSPSGGSADGEPDSTPKEPAGSGGGAGATSWTARDALRALRMSVGLENVDLLLDADGDGRVTSADSSRILRQRAGR